ncbi:MAG: branched-chain amino acid ABC transporter permease [Rubrivivax sp.]
MRLAVFFGCMALLLVGLPFVASGYVLFIANMLLVYVVMTLGLHILIGETGQFGLSHATFYGLGIYFSAYLGSRGFAFPVAIIVSGAAVGLVGLIIGAIGLRMRDIYLALATFAFSEAAHWVVTNWVSVTGGPTGMRIAQSRIGDFVITSDRMAYPIVLAATALMLGLMLLISRSRLGRSFRAVRESELAAMAVGIHVRRTKIIAFGLSAFYAAIAGGLFSTFSAYVDPESMSFQVTMLILTMTVVGGLGSVGGAVSGAIIFGLIAELLRQSPAYREIAYGAILVVFMMYLPKGLFSLGSERVMKKLLGTASAEGAA